VITFQEFNPAPDSAFQFRAVLDGNPYNIVVTWNIYGLRWYINIYTTQGALVYATPLVESPDGYDISMVNGVFATTLVFRDSAQRFEINDAPTPSVPGAINTPKDYMLDAVGNKFMLDISLLGTDWLFDATGQPFVLDQSMMPSEAMLDSRGSQFVLDQSTIAATQDLSGQVLLDANGNPITLDQSQI